ncbi:MAG: hypothetical protein IJ181_12460 [Acidaminococcaceae bacterium]|nr:hypothetical protein [Acidaminococcaceae bacterium]
MLFGTTGAIIAAVVALVAIALGVFKRVSTKKGGIAAIVIGVLAIVMAFSMNGTWSNAFKLLHEKAVEYMPNGLWAQVSEDTNNGLMGIIKKLPNDEATLNALVEEMNDLNKIVDK